MQLDLEGSGGMRFGGGIFAGLLIAIPLWSVIVLLVGNPSFRKAVLCLFCLAVAAILIKVAKVIFAERGAALASNQVEGIQGQVDR